MGPQCRYCIGCNKLIEIKTHNKKYCSLACKTLHYKNRTCLCGKNIPLRAFINGKERNLQNRKRCLNCNPFKEDLILSPSERTNKNKLKCKEYYNSNKEVLNKASNNYQKERRISRKAKIVRLIGGCQICGYNKNYKNIAFHHIDDDKSFGLSGNIAKYNWLEILNELKKCIVICHNCHGDVHEGDVSKAEIKEYNRDFIEKLLGL